MNDLLAPLGEATIQGVALREINGSIDFASLKESGYTAVYIRASAGADYTDTHMRAYAQDARAEDLNIGFYHYLTARTVSEAQAQANYFAGAISGEDAQLRPAMQFECFRGLDISEVNDIAIAFLTAVQQETGVAPLIYTPALDANMLWNQTIAQSWPLWVIDHDADAPTVNPGKWNGWTGWEYTDAGTVEDVGDHLRLSLFTPNVYIPEEETNGEVSPAGTKLICVNVTYGDTLSAIANLFNTTVDSIAKLNCLQNPDRIFPGQRLYIRVADTVPIECCDNYIVKRNDTLSGIASRFGTTVERLAAINQIPDPDVIAVGQSLILGLCGD